MSLIIVLFFWPHVPVVCHFSLHIYSLLRAEAVFILPYRGQHDDYWLFRRPRRPCWTGPRGLYMTRKEVTPQLFLLFGRCFKWASAFYYQKLLHSYINSMNHIIHTVRLQYTEYICIAETSCIVENSRPLCTLPPVGGHEGGSGCHPPLGCTQVGSLGV